MLDYKRRAEAAGKTFPKGLADVQSDKKCNEEWENMSSQEKGYFKAMAKRDKISSQLNVGKRTTYGEYIEELENEERKKEEFMEKMKKYIENKVSTGIIQGNLQKQKFFFMHVNWFYVRELKLGKLFDYFPAEFAIGLFSIERGMEEVYHEIVNDKIEMGFMREANETSERTHRIPVEHEDGEKDYKVMYDKLVAVLKPLMVGNEFPPIFTLPELTKGVHSLLNRMTKAVNESCEMFSIYSLELLFTNLLNAVQESNNNITIPFVVAANEFKKDPFSYVHGLECDFHKDSDSAIQYCSMSVIKRWGYLICDYCCMGLGVECIPGVHCTKDIDNSNLASVNSALGDFTLNSSRNVSLSMTGVSEEHRLERSGRTYQEEQRRRAEAKPVQIIDYSTQSRHNISTNLPVCERPLRIPNSKPNVLADVESISNGLRDLDFPPLGGRGIAIKAKKPEIKFPLGRGRGSG